MSDALADPDQLVRVQAAVALLESLGYAVTPPSEHVRGHKMTLTHTSRGMVGECSCGETTGEISARAAAVWKRIHPLGDEWAAGQRGTG